MRYHHHHHCPLPLPSRLSPTRCIPNLNRQSSQRRRRRARRPAGSLAFHCRKICPLVSAALARLRLSIPSPATVAATGGIATPSPSQPPDADTEVDRRATAGSTLSATLAPVAELLSLPPLPLSVTRQAPLLHSTAVPPPPARSQRHPRISPRPPSSPLLSRSFVRLLPPPQTAGQVIPPHCLRYPGCWLFPSYCNAWEDTSPHPVGHGHAN